MISIDLTTALLLYLGLFLTIAFTAWLLTHLKNRRKKTLPPPYTLTTCEYCHFPYLGKTGAPITECPQCNSLNKHK